ncbi:MAG: hypothetical protein ACYDAR_03625 [Thermomicrobiales bacterium]
MAYTRLDLRNLVRRELADTGSPPLWSDAQLNDDLQAAFQAYAQYFPNATIATFSSGANQTALLLGTGVLSVSAVIVDGVTVPAVPDQATLYEPAFRNQISQTIVQPVTPYGAAATHGQAWALWGGSVNFRYALAAGRAITVYYSASHVLPSDDVTAVTIPDGDIELPVLYACDRLVRSAHTDAIKRGAPGAWADAREDDGYTLRYKTALWMRRDHIVSRTVQALQ